MPVSRCGNGKYRIGSGPCMYRNKAKADKAYGAYKAKKYAGSTYKAMEGISKGR
jgi:hypothetical protein